MVSITHPPIDVLKITLQGSSPPISRRVKVESGLSQDVLHYVIQYAMGWTDSHLHQRIGRGFNPTAFDLKTANAELRRIKA